MYPRRDEKSGRYGFRTRDGWAIAPKFKYASNFMSGYAAVNLVDDSVALIGLDGVVHSLKEICGSRAPVKDHRVHFGDHNSNPTRYASVCTTHRRKREWGLIDTKLNYRPLTDAAFSDCVTVYVVEDNLVLIRPSGRIHERFHGLYNLSEMRLELPLDYSCIYPSREALWVVARRSVENATTSLFAFYDVKKHQLLPGWHVGAKPFSEGFGVITDRNEAGCTYFVDENLQPVFDSRFDDVDRFSHGLAAVYQDEDAGYIDTTGRMRLLLPYARMQPFNRFGLAIANRNESEWDIEIIDREGKPRLTGLDTAVFWEGDFPYFEVSRTSPDRQEEVGEIYDMNLDLVSKQ